MTVKYSTFHLYVLTLALVLLSSACSQTSYVDQSVSGQDARVLNPFDRVVEYQIDLGLIVANPTCIAVGPIEMAEGVNSSQHWVDTIRASIMSRSRAAFPDVAIVEIAADPSVAMMEANIQGCQYVVLTELTTQDETYLMAWSRKRIGIWVRLVHTENGEELWSAKHIASRSEGNVPLDPLAAAVTVFRTTDFDSDGDILPSLLDDAMRRTFSTLPIKWKDKPSTPFHK